SSWFNTGIALVLLLIATAHPLRGEGVAHMADVAAILLATTIFWAYVEFIQFLIIWEENLKFEIPWYLVRLHGIWQPALAVAIVLGFVVPFFVLISGTGKRSRTAVAI